MGVPADAVDTAVAMSECDEAEKQFIAQVAPYMLHAVGMCFSCG
jgi:hypothetical protein